MEIRDFLPMTKSDMEKFGWEKLDFIIVSGDAYVDHPSFGVAIISRILTDAGFKVGIIAQPNWRNLDDIKRLGRPRLGFLVAAGNIDSMVNHYTVSKIRRTTDNYSPGGEMDLRPDRATLVYSNLIRQAFKKTPIIIGGVEASLRRFAHYDYWDNKVRRSILVDSEADLLVYGMGEQQIVEIANYMNDGVDIEYIRHIPGTCYLTDSIENIYDPVVIPSYEEVMSDKNAYAEAFKIQYDEQDPIRGRNIVQKHKDKYLVQNPPAMPLDRESLDRVYNMFYMRNYHPSYEAKGGIPAIREVKFSITSERGCFGACSFCALTFHQGRIVTSRSHDSIMGEASAFKDVSDFKGYIHDVGGPTANFRHSSCEKQLKSGSCKERQCLYPSPCKNLKVDHTDYIDLLRKLKKIDGIKKVFVRSGIRYDYLLADEKKNCDMFLNELVEHHVSGQLKVAPEHIDDKVLNLMGKPAGKTYKEFMDKFFEANERCGKEQYLVPYLMSSHPGSTMDSAINLAEFLRDIGCNPEQVQDFYPTPGTLSTTMYHTGLDPRTSNDPLKMAKVFVPKTKEEKALQRALLQFKKPENKKKVFDALTKAGRTDLIGNGEKCLIRPMEGGHGQDNQHSRKSFGNASKQRFSESSKRRRTK